MREELRTLKDLHQKHATLKDKQIEQLLDGFQKQMQLIDVLRRQKVNIWLDCHMVTPFKAVHKVSKMTKTLKIDVCLD